MYSKAKISNHPIHPMLVAFPIAFYTATVAAYAYYGFGGNNLFWFQLGYVANIAGIVTALIAAVPGFIDWAAGIPNETAAKRTGWTHMLLNVSALVLFGISAWLSYAELGAFLPNVGWQIALGVIGLGMTMTAGFYGWELIGTHHVGVEGQVEKALEIPDESIRLQTAMKEFPHVKSLRTETKHNSDIQNQVNRM